MNVDNWIALAALVSGWIVSGVGLVIWVATTKASLEGRIDLLDQEVGQLREKIADYAKNSLDIVRVEEQIKGLTAQITILADLMKPVVTMMTDKIKTSTRSRSVRQ